MDIQQSVLSKAIYGEQGRIALPLDMFMDKSKKGQHGGKKDIEHLGVPLVLALVNINVQLPKQPNTFDIDDGTYSTRNIEQNYDNHMYNHSPDEYVSYEPISDELYDSLLNTVLDEPIIQQSEIVIPKKYTRKNRK